MKDIVSLNVGRLTEAYIRQVDENNTLITCRDLLQLSYKKGLLQKNLFDEKGDLDIDTVIREGDLTDSGRQLSDDLADKWSAYIDRIQKYDNITMLEKYFNNLNNG